jgi:hypothetical protein
MIRRTRRSLPWLGAVAALLLLALPVQADEIEPEPYFEEEVEPQPAPEVEEETEPAAESNRILQKMIDVAIIRPLYFVRLVTGLPFFVFYPLTLAASDWSDEVVGVLWTDPYEATFLRPLGESPGDY